MGIEFDFPYWTKKYEKDYAKDTGGKYPVFVDELGRECQETSPYFISMSPILQKRGHLLKSEFVSVAEWKTERQKNRYRKNSDGDIEEATHEAMIVPDDRKVQVLDSLKGVGVPVASAILTAIFPEKFCIIDYRSWRALLWLETLVKNEGQFAFDFYKLYSDFLDRYESYYSAATYHRYLNILKAIGQKQKTTPRQVEMALWKFDQMKGIKTEE